MDGRPLPGMSWDPVKKRYFAVSAGQAQGSQSRSDGPEKKVTIHKSKKQRFSKDDRRRAKLPKPIKKLDLFSRVHLMREAGQYASSVMATRARQTASVTLLRDNEIATTSGWSSERRSFVPSSSFVWDAATNSMIMSLQRQSDEISRLGLLTIEEQPGEPAFKTHTAEAWFEAGNLGVQVFNSSITSMCLSPSRILTVTTMGDSFSSELRFMGLEDPANQQPGTPPQVEFEVAFQARRTHQDCDSYWSSAVLPGSDLDTTIAVGTDCDVRLYSSANGADWTHPRSVSIAERDKVDAALSVEWIDHNILAIGQRTGRITLWDTRTSHGASSKAMRLQHPLWVNHLKLADTAGHQLVAASALWATCMYDLRMPYDAKGHGWGHVAQQRPDDFARLKSRMQTWSTPVVQYALHNTSLQDMGCDVNIDNGLLALGTNQLTMGLYSLQNGDLLKNFDAEEDYINDDRWSSFPRTRCKFVDIDGNDALLYTRQQKIRALHWL